MERWSCASGRSPSRPPGRPGSKPGKQPPKEIEQQLLEHDQWKARVLPIGRGAAPAAAVRLFPVGKPEAPHRDSEVLLLRSRVMLKQFLQDHSGVCHIALCPPAAVPEMRHTIEDVRGLLDAVLLNTPGESSAWYLQLPLCYAMEGTPFRPSATFDAWSRSSETRKKGNS